MYDSPDSSGRLFITTDGRTYHDRTPSGWGAVVSGYFADANDGWVLAEKPKARVVGGCDKDVLLATHDGAHTWNRASPQPFDSCLENRYFELDFVDLTHGWYTWGAPTAPLADLYRTTDGGGTWLHVASASERDQDAAALLPDLGVARFFDRETGLLSPTDQTFGGVWVTHDAGRSWSAAKIGWSRPKSQDDFLITTAVLVDREDAVVPADVPDPGDPRIEFAVTRDAGSTWTVRSVSARGRYNPKTDPDLRWPRVGAVGVVSARDWWAVTSSGQVSVTEDGFTTAPGFWAGAGLPTNMIRAPRVWAWSPSEAWLDARFGSAEDWQDKLYGTTDGGHHWAVVDPLPILGRR